MWKLNEKQTNIYFDKFRKHFQSRLYSASPPIGPHIPLPSLCPPASPSDFAPPTLWSSARSPSLPLPQHFPLFPAHLFSLFLLRVFVSVSVSFFFPWPLCLEKFTDRLPSFFLYPSPFPPPPLTPLCPSHPRPAWPAAALMVVSRVGPRGLVEVEDSLGRPGPALTAVWVAYTTVFIPLSSSLYSSKALHFFLWVSRLRGMEKERER